MDTDEILNRIFDKLDQFDSKLDITCNTISSIKTDFELLKQTVNGHLEDIEKSREQKEKKFYAIMALMSAGFTIFEISKSLL